MYHTDYSSNLRNAQRKTLKNLSPNASGQSDDLGGGHELVRAAMAAVLVIIVLLQMDPANAQVSAQQAIVQASSLTAPHCYREPSKLATAPDSAQNRVVACQTAINA